MRFLSVLLAVQMGLPSPVRAEEDEVTCACNILPFEGRYDGTAGLTLTHVDGDVDNCPTQIRIQAPRQDAPDVDVILGCEMGNGIWTGLEPAPMGGVFLHELRPAESQGPDGGAVPAAQLAASVQMIAEMTYSLTPPPFMVSMGHGRREQTIALSGPAQPAACICEQVRQERVFLSQVQQTYLDQALVEQARNAGMRGSQGGQNFWMDDQRQLHRFAGGERQRSYDDLVLSTAKASGIPVGLEDGATPQAAQQAGSRAPDEMRPSAFAQLHPVTCVMTPPRAEVIRESCVPTIIVQAAIVHELHHKAYCERLNTPPVYRAPDGHEIDWASQSGPSVIFIDGITAPSSGYYAWSQSPANHSLDEAGAYGVEIQLIDDWLAQNCS